MPHLHLESRSLGGRGPDVVVCAAVNAMSLDKFVGWRVSPVVVRSLHLRVLQRARTNCGAREDAFINSFDISIQ